MFERSLKCTPWVGRAGYLSAKLHSFQDFCKCTEKREPVEAFTVKCILGTLRCSDINYKCWNERVSSLLHFFFKHINCSPLGRNKALCTTSSADLCACHPGTAILGLPSSSPARANEILIRQYSVRVYLMNVCTYSQPFVTPKQQHSPPMDTRPC